MTNGYLSLFSTTTHWGSVAEVSAALNFTQIVAQDTATYLASQGVGDAYAYEVVEASTRVNYGQNLDQIHAVEGLVSMASGGAKAIKGGNFQIFENFIRESKASVLLNTRVTGLESKSAGRWSLSASKQTNGEQSAVVEEYDAVILAAPFDTLGMSLPSNLEPVIPSPYVHLHVTLLTTTSPAANPAYFNQAPGSDVPDLILTTAQGIRAGGPAPEFNSMGYGHRIAEGSDERVVKIFSEKKIEDEWLSNMFGNVGWVYRKVVS
jgi:prenylcysteine oxidase / farnesylcysteine lyase